MKRNLLIAGFMIFIFSVTLFAQDDLRQTLEGLSEDAARSYLSPISSAFGTDLNAGWFHRAPKPKMVGFTFEVGFVGMGAFFPDDSKSFTETGQFRFSEQEAIILLRNDPNTTDTWADLNAIEREVVSKITGEKFEVEISGATIIGDSKDYVKIKFPYQEFTDIGAPGNHPEIQEQTIELPVAGFKELADISYMPLMSTQFKIGTVLGTDATFRWLPKVKLKDDLGTFDFFGFGLQHNPAVYLPDVIPFDYSLAFYTQTMNIGSLFKTKTTSFGINASKQFGIRVFNVTPYAGFMYETAKMEVSYDYIVQLPGGVEPEVIPINFELKGENQTRLILGVNFMLLIFNLNADYNIGQYNSFSVGVHFAI
ncbi:MAG: hypothetical protein JW956_12560 [Calditrichaceae bacterium]|nr:hypothetical protein [Calditrichaceae bacterium]HES60135.1 hypothetical protein [Caldithrix sp.]